MRSQYRYRSQSSLFYILQPDALVYCCVGKQEFASPVPFAFEELAFINVAIFQVLFAFALLQVGHKLSLIRIAIMGNHFSIAAGFIVYKFPFIDISIGKHQLPISSHFVLEEGALIDILIGPSVLSFAVHHTSEHFAFVDVPIFEVVFSHPVLFAVASLPLIDTIVIFNRLLQILQSVGDPLLAENLLGEVFKLPKNYSVGPVCNFFGRNVRKLAIGQKNIQFFDSQCPILILLELLNGFDALINILFPSDDLSDDFLNAVYVVGLIVNFPQRFDIILSLLDEQSVARFGVGFEFVNSFVHSRFELCTDSIDQLVEFNQIIEFPEFFLDLEMLRSGGPVVHFPHILFLQFLERDKIVLALLVGEFSEADGTQQGAFLAGSAQTDYLDLFVLVLLAHAGQFGFDAQF